MEKPGEAVAGDDDKAEVAVPVPFRDVWLTGMPDLLIWMGIASSVQREFSQTCNYTMLRKIDSPSELFLVS